MRQLPQANLGCRERLYAFSSSFRGLGYEATQYDITSCEKAYSRSRHPRFSWGSWPCACNRYHADPLFSSFRAWVQGYNQPFLCMKGRREGKRRNSMSIRLLALPPNPEECTLHKGLPPLGAIWAHPDQLPPAKPLCS